MSLRTKVFLLFGGILTIFFGLMDLSLSHVLTGDFSALEEREMKENIVRATDALDSNIENLVVKLSDWSQWDDTYEYIQNQNDDYIKSNLLAEGFAPLRINFAAFFGENHKFLFGRFVRDEQEVAFPESLKDHLMESVVSDEMNTRGIHKEIVQLPEGLMVIVSRPVTSSDGLAPPNGIVVFGYILSDERIQELSQLTHLSVSTSLQGDNATNEGFVEAKQYLSFENPYFVGRLRTPEMLSGYALISDARNNPVFILRVDTGREIYQKGQVSIGLFRKLIIFSGVAFTILIFFVLRHFVLNKIAYLSSEVMRVREGGNSDEHIRLSGKDEFSVLAQDIDDMLMSIREIETIRKEGEKRFRTVADTAPVMIWMSDIEKKFTYVNKVWLDFTGKSLENELGHAWEEGIHPEDREKSKAIYETAFERRVDFYAEYRLRGADEKYHWVFVRGIPQFSPSDKKFIGYVGSCVDITERREADLKKEEYIAEIEHMNKIMVARELTMIELKQKIRDLENHVPSKQ